MINNIHMKKSDICNIPYNYKAHRQEYFIMKKMGIIFFLFAFYKP